MGYFFSKLVDLDFDTAIVKVTEELKKEGFGVLSDIDVKKTLKDKIDVDFRRYRILGACNPNFAHKALLMEDKIGLMMPCNVVVQEASAGVVEVAAVDPVASMQAVDSPDLAAVASEVRGKLALVIENL